MKKAIPIFIFSLALLFPWRSFAAVLTIGTSTDRQGAVTIYLDTQDQNVNAVEAHFSFNTDLFSVSGISDAGSIINLWVSGPAFSNTLGTVDVAGIIPGGENTSDGVIATVMLIPKQPAVSTVFTLDDAQVLLNDGKATPAPLSVIINPFMLGSVANVSSTPSTMAPNAFAPEIGQDPNIFGGQYFLVFSTTDQGSGIDHYEVAEVPAGTKVPSSSPSLSWTSASSPYLLSDQTLSSDVYVRAVDTAGNFRMEEVPATHHSSRTAAWLDDAEIILGAIVLLLIIGGIIRRTRKWKRRKRSQDSA